MLRILLTITLIFLVAASINAQNITTVAGGAILVGPALEQPLPTPVAVIADNAGNIYMTMENRHIVLKIDAAGNTTVYAGTGNSRGSSQFGDGGPATSAPLSFPRGLAIDNQGNLLIADSGNHRIRKVDAANGIITTVTGSGIVNGSMSLSPDRPTGVAVDGSGNLYIASEQNHRILKFNPATQITTIVAGTGVAGFSGDGGLATSASLYQPSGVAVDSSGNIYIADTINIRIRKVDTNGVITTVAGGNPNPTPFSDGMLATSFRLQSYNGISLDGTGNLLIATTAGGGSRILKLTSTGQLYKVAGSGNHGFRGDGGLANSANCLLDNPRGVAVDAVGNVYIADTQNNRIRKITAATGIINTVAGNGTFSFRGEGVAATNAILAPAYGVKSDAAGNIYIADSQNNRIRKVNATTGIITTVAGNGLIGFPSGDGGLATSARLSNPRGIAIDNSGNLFIADAENSRVRKVNAATGLISTVAGNGSFAFSGDGGLAASAALAGPWSVAVDGAGNIFICDSSNHRIRKVDTNGVITTVAGSGAPPSNNGFSGDNGLATLAKLNFPRGIALDGAGNLFIADSNNRRIRKVDAATGIITTIAGDGTFGASGDNGLATSAKLNSPFDVALDNAGNLFIADSFNNRIRKVDTNGIITTVAGGGSIFGGFGGDGGPATSALLNQPSGVAIDNVGRLLIADSGNLRIRRVGASNAAPSANAGGPYQVDEGGGVTLSGAGSDPEGQTLAYDWDLDNNGTFETAGQNPVFSAAGLDGFVGSTRNVTLRVTDAGGLAATSTAIVNIRNVAPQIAAFTAPVDPQTINTTVNLSLSYTDPAGSLDAYTVSTDWGDGTTDNNTSHIYTTAGVYRTKSVVSDGDGGVSDEAIYEYVVVYDASAGFVTGGGWIMSPAGAYSANPALTGKASFGFVSKYQKGANQPTGNTEFQFHAADFRFKSDSYQWLVIAGAKAQYKGTGSVNGVAGYSFILTATDGQVNGGGGTDKFRIKIWNAGGVVYDNVMGGSDKLDEANPQAISGGSIVIHSGK